MDNNKLTELFVSISENLGSINAKLTNLCDIIAKHETRITNLEQGKVSFKDSIVKWLVIALIGSIGTIATLTGATGIIKMMLGAG